MLCYCDRCGKLSDWAEPEKQKCYCCGNTPLKPIPRKYIDNFRWRDGDGKEAFIKEVVETSPNLDRDLYNKKDDIVREKSEYQNASLARGNAILAGKDKGNPFGIECPYCHATNVKKISIGSKAAHTALFGIFSIGRNSKQWHCNHCNSDF